MSSGHMGATPKDKSEKEDCSQVAGILLEEFERIVYQLE